MKINRAAALILLLISYSCLKSAFLKLNPEQKNDAHGKQNIVPNVDQNKKIYTLLDPNGLPGYNRLHIDRVIDRSQTGTCSVYDANRKKAYCAHDVKINLMETAESRNNITNPPKGYYLLGYYQVNTSPQPSGVSWENRLVWAPKK